jgi:hypothetical protein
MVTFLWDTQHHHVVQENTARELERWRSSRGNFYWKNDEFSIITRIVTIQGKVKLSVKIVHKDFQECDVWCPVCGHEMAPETDMFENRYRAYICMHDGTQLYVVVYRRKPSAKGWIGGSGEHGKGTLSYLAAATAGVESRVTSL